MRQKQWNAVRDLFVKGIYDPRINQGMWLSLATVLLYLLFVLSASEDYAIYSILVILPVLIAKIDKPGPRFFLRLVKVTALFWGASSFVLFLRFIAVPLPLIFFPLIFFLAMFAVYGDEAGAVGTGAMFVATLSLTWPESSPFWGFSLFIAFGTLWYGICARLWTLKWGHRVLRDTLARLFAAIAQYYGLKTSLLLTEEEGDVLQKLYLQQKEVYLLINQSKSYLNRFGEARYDTELRKLKQDYLFGVDLMELLQANQHKVDDIRRFIKRSQLEQRFTDMSDAVIACLQRKSFAVRIRGAIHFTTDEPITAFEEALLMGKEANSQFVRSLLLHLHALKRLLNTQRPAFERELEEPRAEQGLLATLRPHSTFRSPPLRYALRLACTMVCGLLVADFLGLHKNHWMLLAILLVMQSGYLLTKTMIFQRVLGTLAGVLVALALFQLSMSSNTLLFVCFFVALFSFCMLFFHRVLAIGGVTTLVVLSYELAFGSGQEVVFVRLVDSLLGCGLAFASNIILWPQWNGGGIKRLIQETLYAQEDILVFCIRSLADKTIKFEQLSRRRLRLYTAQNNLLASYQQMLREPQHTREYVDSLDRVLAHFVATSAHINGLLPLLREIDPMPVDLAKHMELAVVSIFGRCDEEDINDDSFEAEVGAMYRELEELKKGWHDPRHLAIVHLLELIFERLNMIFEQLEFCGSRE